MMTTANARPGLYFQPVTRAGTPEQSAIGDDIIGQIEHNLESWRRITYYLTLARMKRFNAMDEDQFLDLKGIIAQELEMIWASGQCSSPTKEEVHALINNVSSLRHLSQLSEGALRNLETQWHLIYMGWQSVLGQLKVKLNRSGSSSRGGTAMWLRRLWS